MVIAPTWQSLQHSFPCTQQTKVVEHLQQLVPQFRLLSESACRQLPQPSGLLPLASPELWLHHHLPLAIYSLVSCLLGVVGLWAASCWLQLCMWLFRLTGCCFSGLWIASSPPHLPQLATQISMHTASTCSSTFAAAVSTSLSLVQKRLPSFTSGLQAFWTLASWPSHEP